MQQLETALVKAHRGGDTRGAQAIAGEIKRLRAAPPATPTTAQRALANAKKDAAGRLADAKRTNNKSAEQTYQREVTRLSKLTPDQFYKAPGMGESFVGGLVEGVTTPIRLGLDLIGAGGDKGQRERGTFRLRESQKRFPITTATGKIAGDVLGTVLLPGAAAKVVTKVAGGTKTGQAVATALGSTGFKTGLLPTRAAVKEGLANAPKLIDRVVDLALRGTAGAATGAGMAVASGQTEQDVGISSIIGALMPTVGSATFRTAMDKVLLPAWERLSNQLGVQQAAAVFRNAFNMDIQDALALARSAKGDTPFAKVVAQSGADEPTVQALFKTVSEGGGKDIYAPLARAETQAQQDVLNAMARGTTGREARNAMMQSRSALGEQYAADQAAAFERANLGGQVIPRLETKTAQATQQAAEQSDLAHRMAYGANRAETRIGETEDFYARIGDEFRPEMVSEDRGLAGAMAQRTETAAQQALRLREEAAAAQQQIADLNAQGIRALETRPLADQIRSMAGAEGAGEVQQKALLDVARQIESKGPIIRAGDLDAIRRGANVTIARLNEGLDVGSVNKAAAGVVSQIKPLIDDAIETAGGVGYKGAKTAFGTGASDIERQQFADQLAGMFESGPAGQAQFAATVGGQRGTTGTVEAAFPRAGSRNFDIQEMMGVPGGAAGPSRMPALENIAGEVQLSQKMATQAEQGEDLAKNLLKTPPQEKDIFHNYSPVGMLTNAGRASLTFAKILSDTGLSTKVQRALAEGFRSGEAAEKLLLTIPLADRAQVARRMVDNGLLSAKAMTGIATFNAMNTPPGELSGLENRNMMRR